MIDLSHTLRISEKDLIPFSMFASNVPSAFRFKNKMSHLKECFDERGTKKKQYSVCCINNG